MPTEPSPLKELLRKLEFEPNGIVQAAAEQPKLFMQAAEHRVHKMEARAHASAALDRVRAERSLIVRKKAVERDEPMSEKKVEATLLTSPSVRAATSALDTAEQAEEYAKLLVDAYRMRRDCLKIIGELAAREVVLQKISEDSAAKVSAVRRKLQQKYNAAVEDE